MLNLKYIIGGLFISINLFAGNIPLTFTTLDTNDSSSKKVMELFQKDSNEKYNFSEMKNFHKINENIYLYNYCASPKWSGIRIINLKEQKNKYLAANECSLGENKIVMFNKNNFNDTFTLLISEHNNKYYNVSEIKCDKFGECKVNRLVNFEMGKDDKPTLCTEQESNIFSCATSKKVISICETKYEDKKKNILTYRYGKLNTKPELEYSSKEGKMENYFKYAYDGYRNGSTKEISFEIGTYRYTINQDNHTYKDNSAGLTIEKNNKKIKYLPCNNQNPKNSWRFDFKLKEHKARGIGEGTERL